MERQPHDRAAEDVAAFDAEDERAPADPAVRELEQAVHVARQEAAEYQDRYLRLRADNDNFKRRIERQHADLARSARRSLLLKILGVMDNLERALQFQSSATSQSASDRDGLATGLRLTHWQMNELLKSEGLKEIPTVGQPFDPRLHEAVDTVAGTPEQEGTITAESQKGYQLDDDVVRPAKVTVMTTARP